MQYLITFGRITLLLLALASCETDESSNEDYSQWILGRWYQQVPTDHASSSFRNEMVFHRDGTYEESHQVVETDDAQRIIEYRSLFTGEYEVVNNRLRRFNVQQYGPNNGNFPQDRDDLVLDSSTDSLPDVELLLNKAKDQLTIDYCADGPCPGYVSYIEFQTYYRER